MMIEDIIRIIKKLEKEGFNKNEATHLLILVELKYIGEKLDELSNSK